MEKKQFKNRDYIDLNDNDTNQYQIDKNARKDININKRDLKGNTVGKDFEKIGTVKKTELDVGTTEIDFDDLGKLKIGGKLKITSGGDFYRGYRSTPQSRYVTRPHLVNASESKRRKHGQVKRITAGSGPLAMVMIYIMDFIIDAFIEIGSEILIFFSDGFEWTYMGVMGGFKGIVPEDPRNDYKDFQNKLQGTVISYKYFRYLITIISPPVGVFLGKGLRGFMSIIICTALTFMNYVLGIIYALTITYKNRFADYYEEYESRKYRLKERELQNKNQSPTFKHLVGFILIILFIYGTFSLLLWLL